MTDPPDRPPKDASDLPTSPVQKPSTASSGIRCARSGSGPRRNGSDSTRPTPFPAEYVPGLGWVAPVIRRSLVQPYSASFRRINPKNSAFPLLFKTVAWHNPVGLVNSHRWHKAVPSVPGLPGTPSIPGHNATRLRLKGRTDARTLPYARTLRPSLINSGPKSRTRPRPADGRPMLPGPEPSAAGDGSSIRRPASAITPPPSWSSCRQCMSTSRRADGCSPPGARFWKWSGVWDTRQRALKTSHRGALENQPL